MLIYGYMNFPSGVLLTEYSWSGNQQGADKYPKFDNYGFYLIAGGQDIYFRPQNIEVFGFNI